jgi:hypothetical protein
MTSNKEPTQYMLMEDIIGVERHPKNHHSFVVYGFPKTNNVEFKRERKVLPFVCESTEQADNWIKSIRCVLRGVPVQGKLEYHLS